MCGRSRCSLAPEQVCQAAGVAPERWHNRDKYRPTYNMSPGAYAPIEKLNPTDGSRELQSMKCVSRGVSQ